MSGEPSEGALAPDAANGDDLAAESGVATAMPSRKARAICLVTLAYGHFVGDGYMGFISVWLALATAGFALSHKAYGWLGMLPSVTSSFAQPLFGHWADRRPRSRAVAFGPAICGVVCLLGWARSVGAVAVCLLVAGAGAALFHPGSASSATLAGGVRRRGLAMSLFSAGGAAGFALAPWIGPWLWSTYGRENLWHLMGAGLVATTLIILLGRLPAEMYSAYWPGDRDRAAGERGARGGTQWAAVWVVFVIVTCRAATATALGTFLPKLFLELGQSETAIGVPNLVLLGAGGLAAIIGGSLSDRLGRRPVTAATLLLTAPALWMFFEARSGVGVLAPPAVSGWLSDHMPALPFLALAGALLNTALPVNIVQMQELMPAGRSLAASLSMGLAWGIGALANLAVGKIADAPDMGLAKALALVAVLPLLAGLVALLPLDGKRKGNGRTATRS
jgi:FSR family fosmidomycin resistance protein-like MFS transporter